MLADSATVCYCCVDVVHLQAAGLVDAVDLSNVDRLSMACPALPLCGLAITEAERGLPDINRWDPWPTTL